ncbi:pentapeptide repeat-containing protein [Angustibacter luteus]
MPAFSRSADFALDKPAGQPCVNLLADHRCSIHDTLRDRGFAGCTVYDCFGAGQHVVQRTFGGRSWQDSPELAAAMFPAYQRMRDLHELLWYLADALGRPETEPVHDALLAAQTRVTALTDLDADALAAVDSEGCRREVDPVLTRASELVRGPSRRPAERRGADLVGRDLSGADLVGANLRGAYLIGANLRGADLRGADVIGADLRGADVHGADLSSTLYLTAFQVNAARGDAATALPPSIGRPGHWRASKHRR